MNLNRVREPGGDEQFPIDRIPTLQAGAAKICIPPYRLSQRRWNRRNSFDNQVFIGTNNFILCEGCSGEKEQDYGRAQEHLHQQAP